MSIPLNGTINLATRCICGQSLVINTKSISCRIRVREHPRLQHLVRTRFDARDHIAGAKGCLFDLCEPVLRVTVELHAPTFPQWVERFWPGFGHVEDINGCGSDLVWVDSLHVDVPGREIAGADGLLEI